MTWQEIAEEAQAAVLNAIPSRWRLDAKQYESLKDVTNVPYTCGLMTKEQLSITELTVLELVKRLESRQLKAVQVLEAFAARAAIAHQLVNCLTDWFYEEGLQQARELDETLDKGGKLKGPLHGVPVALKDVYEIKGHAVTLGFVVKRDNIAKQDCALVSTLREAGAVFFCKTTLPQTVMALETVSNLWGRTTNPFNRELTPGGSSGGDGALVAMKGAPIAPSTDIGGSIRVPAAFNGLYGLRPTSTRVPLGGMVNTVSGNLTIKVSVGPICHSLEDLEMFTEVINAHPRNKYDVTCVPVPWRSLEPASEKLTIGICKWDGVVMPHPPVLRALEHTRKTLEKAGHTVVDVELLLDCWDALKTTFGIYQQSGRAGTESALARTGEPMIPAFANLLKVFKPRDQSAEDVMQLNIKTRALKEQFGAFWESQGIDSLILPSAPAVGFPHEFNAYWGYTSLFNLLDYPSVILPVPKFKVDAQLDPIDENYVPLESNPYDKPNHEIYNPQIYANQPSTIQIVGRPYYDEETIQVATVLDTLFKNE